MKNHPKIQLGFSTLPVILVVISVIIFVFFITKELTNKAQLDDEMTQLQAEIEDLNVEQNNLLTLIDDYQGQYYIEKEARDKLNLKKEGEKVVVINLEQVNKVNDSANNSQNDQIDKTEKQSNFVLWWEYFFGQRNNL